MILRDVALVAACFAALAAIFVWQRRKHSAAK
jgi:hypothetical protein